MSVIPTERVTNLQDTFPFHPISVCVDQIGQYWGTGPGIEAIVPLYVLKRGNKQEVRYTISNT